MQRKHSFPTGAMPFGMLLVCLMVLMGATQTIDPADTEMNNSAICQA